MEDGLGSMELPGGPVEPSRLDVPPHQRLLPVGPAGEDVAHCADWPVARIMGGVQGFVSYTLVRTGDGGVTVTVCQDKAGTDESVTVARDWVAANASDVGAPAPAVSEGAVDLSFP